MARVGNRPEENLREGIFPFYTRTKRSANNAHMDIVENTDPIFLSDGSDPDFGFAGFNPDLNIPK